KTALLVFSKANSSPFVRRPFHPPYWVHWDNPFRDGKRQNAPEQAYSPRGCPGTALDNRATAKSSLDVVSGLTLCHVPHESGDIRRLQIPHRTAAEQRQDMPLNSSAIHIQSGRFLGSPSFPKNQALL